MRGHDPDFFFVLMWTPLSLSSGVDSAVKRICLGGKDPLEKEMATRTSILAWRIPWREEPGRLQSTGSQESGTTW